MQHDASFRDPSGFLFWRNGRLLRQINRTYREGYDTASASGLFDELIAGGLLIPHVESANEAPLEPSIAYKVIAPEIVPFISYPYEWCFSELRDSALVTLDIFDAAIRKNLILKDGTAYNIQFHKGRPILIDTLSFERWNGEPWFGYRQFCQHFLAPLLLMSLTDVRLGQLSRVFVDGVPLDLASRLLPWKTHTSLSIGGHIHWHAKLQSRYAATTRKIRTAAKTSQKALLALSDNLRNLISGLKWEPASTEWADYYDKTNYTNDSFAGKQRLVIELMRLNSRSSRLVFDLGSNTGLFSRIISESADLVVSADYDHSAVELNYRNARREKNRNILPLLIDLTNPSPDLGWASNERTAFFRRQRADTTLALALVHHLAISNNLPLSRIASFFKAITGWLIIEFVPKEDSQVQRLLTNRVDIFPDYNDQGFEAAMSAHGRIVAKRRIPETLRSLYAIDFGLDRTASP